MSFRLMLAHRAKILELTPGEVNGYSTHVWAPVTTTDSSYIPPGSEYDLDGVLYDQVGINYDSPGTGVGITYDMPGLTYDQLGISYDDGTDNISSTGGATDLVIPCFLDLNYIRKGKDMIWTPEAGRAADRTGVLFALPDAPIKASSRLQIIKGPIGTYSVNQVVDQSWRPTDLHHLEVGVTECAQQTLVRSG